MMIPALYLAPMEEVTGYTFRNTISKVFGGVDKYFTPFITPNQNKLLKTKEGRELVPAHNEGLKVVPQLLSGNGRDIVDILPYIRELGYDEVNLNFGCPSGTVVKKYKGSGILRDTERLEELLDAVFAYEAHGTISVKTRLAYDNPEEFEGILAIYNKYPISELIIHARVGTDMYKGNVRMEDFLYAYDNTKLRLCYNGDISNIRDYKNITEKCPNVNIMIGRGAVRDPGIFRNIRNGGVTTAEELFRFHTELGDSYCRDFGTNNALFKMKEVWNYMSDNFRNIDKELKIIRKTKSYEEYNCAAERIFKYGEWCCYGDEEEL